METMETAPLRRILVQRPMRELAVHLPGQMKEPRETQVLIPGAACVWGAELCWLLRQLGARVEDKTCVVVEEPPANC